jgi:hypothetical protein
MQVRALVSAGDAGKAWDLRCRVREALIDFLQRDHPDALPRVRAELETEERRHAPAPSPPPLRAGKGDSTAIKEPTHAAVGAVRDSRAPVEMQDGITGKGG